MQNAINKGSMNSQICCEYTAWILPHFVVISSQARISPESKEHNRSSYMPFSEPFQLNDDPLLQLSTTSSNPIFLPLDLLFLCSTVIVNIFGKCSKKELLVKHVVQYTVHSQVFKKFLILM